MRVSVVDTASVDIEVSIAGHEINVPRGVGGQTSTALPDAASVTVGGGVIDQHLLKSGRVISQYPAVPRGIIAVGSEREINHAIAEKKAGSLVFSKSVERLPCPLMTPEPVPGTLA